MKEAPRGSLKTAGGGVGIASSSDGFLRFLAGCSGFGVLASFFGLPRFGGDVTTSPSPVAVLVLFFGLPRFFGALAEAVVSASVDGTDTDASAESVAAVVAFCFLCRFGGSGRVRYPSGSPCLRKQSSTLHSTRPAGS